MTAITENNLHGFEKKYLKGLAHNLKPVVFVGKNGMTDAVVRSTEQALTTHELIKIRFIDFKEKALKQEIMAGIQQRTAADMVSMVGHTAVLYRQHADPEKRKIQLPVRK